MSLKQIGVVGAGQMGNGIVQVFAAKGFSATMLDVSEVQLEKGLATIAKSCDRLIKKEKMTADDKESLLSRIQLTTDMKKIADCDFVIEAATENLDLKLKIFRQLDEVTDDNTILCTNTSSISITKIAGATSKPDKVAGMHFYEPGAFDEIGRGDSWFADL